MLRFYIGLYLWYGRERCLTCLRISCFEHFILVVLRENSYLGTYRTRIHYRLLHFQETVQFYSAVGPKLFILDSDPTFQVFSDLDTDLIYPSKAK